METQDVMQRVRAALAEAKSQSRTEEFADDASSAHLTKRRTGCCRVTIGATTYYEDGVEKERCYESVKPFPGAKAKWVDGACP